MTTDSAPAGNKSLTQLLLAFGALGVVYGDIGTSPLYAFNETFFGHYPVSRNPVDIIGVLSLFFWALTLVISVKYLIFILRADNHGEGGVFSELSLIQSKGRKTPVFVFISFLLAFGACLLYAEGLITPAISVLSAVEGLAIIAPGFKSAVVPITVVILILLFMVQRIGTGKISRYFGLIMLVWFLSIGLLAVPYIIAHPQVLEALNPVNAVSFLFTHQFHSLFVLGAVTLCITGGEALYADMGHFGRTPIRIAWYFVVYPCLVLNYFGQGAYLLADGTVFNGNVFYSLAPDWFLIPLVILATMATVIASQALISGAFSLTQQAIGLGFFPRIKIVHTSHELHGQIYMPAVNWLLMAGTIGLVLAFKSSSNLAVAYGLTVTATMSITTFGFFIVATEVWGWRKVWVAPVIFFLFMIDFTFFTANTLKFLQGGFVPVVIGLGLFSVMWLWNWGRGKLGEVYRQATLTLGDLFALKGVEWQGRMPAKINFFSPSPVVDENSQISLSLQTFITRYHMLPSGLSFITVQISPQPVWNGPRVVKYNLPEGMISIVIRYGYMEEIKLAEILERENIKGSILVGDHEIVSDDSSAWHNLKVRAFRNLLRLALPTYRYFGMRGQTKIIKEIMPVEFTKKTAFLLDVE
ncbi:MAG: KUP/HAK/KT family potassium transporter [Bacteroidetes bacterium]|nr:KUP/HAK/KT family potassium transporter [Bacteroidota bacterium]